MFPTINDLFVFFGLDFTFQTILVSDYITAF